MIPLLLSQEKISIATCELWQRSIKKEAAEIILIGGAAVLVNYGFRNMTYDVNAIIPAVSAMKEAINAVGDAFHLPNEWLNSDFTRTKSYSSRLIQYSTHYKTFLQILEVRTVSGEYLISMKLMSGRRYKNDISDIVGILREQKIQGQPLSMEQIDKAVCHLYENWDNFPEESKSLIENLLSHEDLDSLYQIYQAEEQENKSILLNFEEEYPHTVTDGNIHDILANLKLRKQKEET